MKLVKHINAAGAVLRDSALPAATQELVRLRASQINGSCTDMHTKGGSACGGKPAAAEPGRSVAGGEGLHRGGAGRAGTRRAGSDLEATADRVEIEALRGEFTDAAMTRDYDRLTLLFTSDGTLRIPTPTSSSPAAGHRCSSACWAARFPRQRCRCGSASGTRPTCSGPVTASAPTCPTPGSARIYSLGGQAFVAGDRAVLVITAQGVAEAQLLQAAPEVVPHG
jgi:AhpD family alkylhydroperoxidase